jgi:hypothetical protein
MNKLKLISCILIISALFSACTNTEPKHGVISDLSQFEEVTCDDPNPPASYLVEWEGIEFLLPYCWSLTASIEEGDIPLLILQDRDKEGEGGGGIMTFVLDPDFRVSKVFDTPDIDLILNSL